MKRLNPAIMGAIEKKIVEGVLRLTEAHQLLNHLKTQLGYESVTLESILPIGGASRDKDESQAVFSINGSPDARECQT